MSYPSHLYKYQTLSAYALGSVVNETIWLAKPSTFNDPFDCAITLDRSKYRESIVSAIGSLIEHSKDKGLTREKLAQEWPVDEDIFEDLRSTLRDFMQNQGICSFSSDPKHMLLWSHYANNHQGYCIEYSSGLNTSLRKSAQKVIYSNDIPKFSAADFSGENTEEVVKALWLTKAKCRKYESEWRVLHSEGNVSLSAPSTATAIIFGARMRSTEKTMVMHALRYQPQIRFRQAQLKEDSFSLEIVEYEPDT